MFNHSVLSSALTLSVVDHLYNFYTNTTIYYAEQAAESLELPVPHIALCLTPTGSLSRVLNSRFTPVTHDLLPTAAAPGQLTSDTILRYAWRTSIL
jgi:3-dehydroquinate dehydratase